VDATDCLSAFLLSLLKRENVGNSARALVAFHVARQREIRFEVTGGWYRSHEAMSTTLGLGSPVLEVVDMVLLGWLRRCYGSGYYSNGFHTNEYVGFQLLVSIAKNVCNTESLGRSGDTHRIILTDGCILSFSNRNASVSCPMSSDWN
jgi:hypothetical protein